MILEMLLKIFSRNELGMKAEWDTVWHLKTTDFFVGFCVVQNEVALSLLFVVDITADVKLVISSSNDGWLSSNLILVIID